MTTPSLEAILFISWRERSNEQCVTGTNPPQRISECALPAMSRERRFLFNLAMMPSFSYPERHCASIIIISACTHTTQQQLHELQKWLNLVKQTNKTGCSSEVRRDIWGISPGTEWLTHSHRIGQRDVSSSWQSGRWQPSFIHNFDTVSAWMFAYVLWNAY